MKKYVVSIIYLAAIILLFVFSRFRWDVVNNTNYMVGTVTTLLMTCAYIGMTVFATFYAVIGAMNKIWQAVIPVGMCFLVLLFVLWFAFTPLYSSFEHKVYLSARKEVIELVESGRIANQISTDRYIPPQRMASYDGTVRVIEGDERYVIFTSFIGVKKNLMVVYSKNAIDKIGELIYGEVIEVRKLEEDWYSVIAVY